MDDPESDPWNSPDVHKGHAHHRDDVPATPPSDAAAPNGSRDHSDPRGSDGESFPSMTASTPAEHTRSISAYADPSASHSPRHAVSSSQPTLPTSSAGGVGWGGYYETADQSVASPGGGVGGFGEPANPFGSNQRLSGGGVGEPAGPPLLRTASGRTGNALEEVVSVALMPEKEGFFLFQHHNYEVTSSRRGSKVVRRYSDFVWLLECLHKRYPFRALPPLPPKRVAGEFRPPPYASPLCQARVSGLLTRSS